MTTSNSLLHTHRFLVLLLIFGAAIAACTPQEPIRVFITPTQLPPTEAAVETLAVTSTAEATATLTATLTVPTLEAVSPTPLPEQPTAQFTTEGFGPIIDAAYVLPPTSTPRPTETPTATLTPTQSVTPVATPIASLPRLDGNRMGIQLYWNLDIDTWYIMLQRAKKMNFAWIKLQADWSFLQPNNPDEYEQSFRLFTGHVQQAKNLGFQVLISVAKAPDWARNMDRTEDGPPDNPEDLARFLRFMITQVKAENIDGYEIWNEPNLIREWRGGLPRSGVGYMQLFAPAYRAVRELDPSAFILTGGLAPTSSIGGNIDDRDYLREMYASGLAQYADVAVGFHPYSWANPPDFFCCNLTPNRGWDDDPHFFFADTLREYRQIMQENNHTVPLWATEFGWSTWDGYPSAPPEPWVTYNTAQDQLYYTVRAFEIVQALDNMGPMFLWNLNFAGPDLIGDSNEMAGYSLFFDPGGAAQQRPLYDVLTQITTLNP